MRSFILGEEIALSNAFRSWFVHNVAATYDYYARVRDGNTSGRLQHRRAAIDVSLALYHLREHLPASIIPSRAQIESECTDYATVADVANVAKHGKLDFGKPAIDDVSAIEEVCVLIQYIGEEPNYINSFTSVRVKVRDGRKLDLDYAITEVYNFWAAYLATHDIANYKAREHRPDSIGKLVSREEAKAPKLEMMRGLDWITEFEMRYFNVSTGEPENCDLTDAELEFRIYRPSYKLDITVSLPGQADQTVTIALTDEESLQYSSLKTEFELSEFQKWVLVNHSKVFEEQANAILNPRGGQVSVNDDGTLQGSKFP